MVMKGGKPLDISRRGHESRSRAYQSQRQKVLDSVRYGAAQYLHRARRRLPACKIQVAQSVSQRIGRQSYPNKHGNGTERFPGIHFRCPRPAIFKDDWRLANAAAGAVAAVKHFLLKRVTM